MEARIINDILLLGTLRPNDFLMETLGGRKHIYESLVKNRNPLMKKLNSVSPVTYIAHPKYKEVELYDCNKIKYLKDLDSEQMKTSLFILDYPGHTFFYQAVYQSIPFLLFFSRDWMRYFSQKYINLLKLLEKHQMLFYWDQEEDFLKHLKSLIREKHYKKENFLIVREFLEKGVL